MIAPDDSAPPSGDAPAPSAPAVDPPSAASAPSAALGPSPPASSPAAPAPAAGAPAPVSAAAPAAPPEEDFAALFAASEAKHPAQTRARVGDVVQGRVIALGPDNAFVAIGAKAEAVVSLAEFRDPTTGEVALAVGDELTATVTDDGSRSGSIVLKRTLGRGGRVPGELEEAREHGIAVEGVVTGQNKGGYDVQVAGVRATRRSTSGSASASA